MLEGEGYILSQNGNLIFTATVVVGHLLVPVKFLVEINLTLKQTFSKIKL